MRQQVRDSSSRKTLFSRLPVWFALALFSFGVLVVLPSFPKSRALLSAPLVVHDPQARGDACYVLAGGGALWERLDAAADLVQMGRVQLIYLARDTRRGPYSFKAGRPWTKAEWAADYLAWRGVPAGRIVWVPEAEGAFGTLTEARSLARALSGHVSQLVLVSSAPHMRRSLLAFKRSLPARVRVAPYSATDFVNSYEMHHPIWTEYLKLLVYSAVS